MSRLFDAHGHLNEKSMTPEEKERYIKGVEEENMEGVMDVGYDLESSMKAVNHSEKYPWCYAVIGCHPHDSSGFDDIQLEMIKGLAKKKKVKAIGEIGLDFYRNISEPDIQEHWFRKQIQLANELKMPIVIHERDAVAKVMEILKEEGAFKKERASWFPERKGPDGEMLPDCRVMIHCFSASREVALQYAALGATISIAGPVTYKNNRKTVEVVEALPIEFMTVETDAPYLTPEPLRGRKNMSSNVRYTAQKIADIKGMEYDEVVRITCENAKRFFNIRETGNYT